MAPTPHLLPRATRYHSHSSGSSGGGIGGGIGGGVIAVILLAMLIIFICVYIHEYNKAKRLHATKGTPIRKSACFKKAFLIAITVGLVSLLCAECCGIGDNDTGDGAGNGGGNVGVAPSQMDQMAGGGGFVQQPMPSWQPQMDMGPVTSAAIDPVQG